MPLSNTIQDLPMQLPQELPETVVAQEESTELASSNNDPQDILMQGRHTASTHAQPVELSVIAEADEGMERSRSSIQPAPKSPPRNNDAQSQVTPMQVDDPARVAPHDEAIFPIPRPHSEDDTHLASTSSTSSFHSIPLDSPLAKTTSEARKPEEPSTCDITVPIRDPELQPPSPKPATHKSVLSALPTLPEPIPLRKSMRAARDPSVGGVMHGAATPGNATAGKRTSWLMKAREAKAMVGIVKKSIANHPPVATPGLVGAKRKSEETSDPAEPGDEERLFKVIKLEKDETAPTKAASPKVPGLQADVPVEVIERSSQDGMLDLLKKKVQGLEARNEKLGNKVHGDAAAALAEARAQAEARIAERNHKEEGLSTGIPLDGIGATEAPTDQAPAGPSTGAERRFSVSDLFPLEGKIKDKSKAPEKSPVFQTRPVQPNPLGPHATASRESTSTTPPHSPPAQSSSSAVPSAPVFNKPPPVFVPPVPSTRPLPTPPSFKETSFNLPPLPAFTKPAPMALGISPSLGSPPSNKAAPLSAQSTMETIQSDDLFGDRGNTEAWVPSTQDTEYSSAFGSQQQTTLNHQNALDDDDSWPIDEKLSQGVHWPFGGPSKEDSMTWSTFPSQSQKVDTATVSKGLKDHESERIQEATKRAVPDGFDEDMDIEQEDYNTGTEQINQDPELEELILSGAKSTVTSVGVRHSILLFRLYIHYVAARRQPWPNLFCVLDVIAISGRPVSASFQILEQRTRNK